MVFLWGLYFFVLVFLVFYLPGRFLLRISKFAFLDSWMTLPLSLGVGSTVFIASIYLLSWVHAEIFYLLLLIPIIFLEARNLLTHAKKISFSFPVIECLIIFLGSAIALFITGRSGSEINGQLFFYGVNATDAVFHLSLIGNLVHHFPPTHAGMAGVALHGYNFLYDLMVASFAKFFFFNPFDLFFRYFSLFVAGFYGLSALALARFLKMDSVTTKFFLFLAYFAQGMTFLFQYLHIQYDPGVVQPLANIVDPSVLFSVSLFFLSFILLFSLKQWPQVVLAAIMLAVIPMIKIYTAFLLFAALGCITLLSFVLQKKEKWMYASLLLAAGILAGIIYAPINLGVGKLVFTPFLLYTHFLESYAPLNHSDWWMKMLVYFDSRNYLRIIQNYLMVLALFFLPSLSLRLFSLVSLKNIFKKEFYTLQHIFLLIAILVGFLIPSFFIQNIAVFVIIQFLWITYFLLLIPTAFGLSTLYRVLPKFGKVVFVLFIIGISLPDMLSLITLYASHPTIIPASSVAIAKEVNRTVSPHEGVLVLNTKKDGERMQTSYSIPLVSAISGHDVYYEPEVLEFSGLDREVAKRQDLVSEIDQTLSSCDDKGVTGESVLSLLENAKSTYLLTLDGKPCLNSLTSLKLVSQKGEAALYKVR